MLPILKEVKATPHHQRCNTFYRFQQLALLKLDRKTYLSSRLMEVRNPAQDLFSYIPESKELKHNCKRLKWNSY